MPQRERSSEDVAVPQRERSSEDVAVPQRERPTGGGPRLSETAFVPAGERLSMRRPGGRSVSGPNPGWVVTQPSRTPQRRPCGAIAPLWVRRAGRGGFEPARRDNRQEVAPGRGPDSPVVGLRRCGGKGRVRPVRPARAPSWLPRSGARREGFRFQTTGSRALCRAHAGAPASWRAGARYPFSCYRPRPGGDDSAPQASLSVTYSLCSRI